jgi:hypothetical protein
MKTPQPTHHRPGTLEKVLVMAARYEAGECLYHEDDAVELATIEESVLLRDHSQRVFRVEARGYRFLKEHIRRFSEE